MHIRNGEARWCNGQPRAWHQVLTILSKTLDDKPGRTTLASHKIRTEKDQPIHQHLYRVPAAWQEDVCREIQAMLDLDETEPSDSPWALPIVVTRTVHSDYILITENSM